MKLVILILIISNLFVTEIENGTGNTSSGKYRKKTIQYKSVKGINRNLLSLDVYYFKGKSAPKPVVIYVHGGGWCIGDKANKMSNKTGLFSKLGYVFVSVNYRLSPFPYQTATDNRIKYPDQNNDVASAIKWVYENIANYGGNPDKIALMGHSAGAHLVSLTGTNETFLKNEGLPLTVIKGVASIDTKGYDVYEMVNNSPMKMMYLNAFGTDSLQNIEASPVYNIRKGKYYPMFFVAYRGNKQRKTTSYNFIKKLKNAGVEVSYIDCSVYDHEGINNAIGDKKDTIITPALINFFEKCFR